LISTGSGHLAATRNVKRHVAVHRPIPSTLHACHFCARFVLIARPRLYQSAGRRRQCRLCSPMALTR
jgi:hypothetical protein